MRLEKEKLTPAIEFLGEKNVENLWYDFLNVEPGTYDKLTQQVATGLFGIFCSGVINTLNAGSKFNRCYNAH